MLGGEQQAALSSRTSAIVLSQGAAQLVEVLGVGVRHQRVSEAVDYEARTLEVLNGLL